MEDRIKSIVNEIKEKKGDEWVGLQSVTEKQLESLMWYLEHPRLHEMPELTSELVDLYDNARESKFTKMEGIIRKLDQLSIKLGHEDYKLPEGKKGGKKLMFQNYPQAIKELQTDIAILMHSPHGTTLPDLIQKSILTFHNYLNHPDLPPELFDEMHEKYEFAKATDFLKLQAFNDLLNKLDIKLGEITEEMKTFKSIKEQSRELEAEKTKLAEEVKKLQEEKEKLKKEKDELEEAKNILLKEWEEYNELINKLEAKLKKT